MDVPAGASDMMTYYSYFLKLEGITFASFWFVAYFVKFGFVWHDAGEPLTLDIETNTYFNMILMVYGVLGIFIFFSSFNPDKHKSLNSFVMWGGELSHAIIATVGIFTDFTPQYTGPTMFGEMPPEFLGLTHYPNLFIDTPFLYLMFGINLYFSYKVFGSALLPWDL